MKPIKFLCIAILAFCVLACDYGAVGGANRYVSIDISDPEAEALLDSFTGEWYSAYASRHTDGYTIGKIEDLPTETETLDRIKAYFPDCGFTIDGGAAVTSGYYIFYDDLGDQGYAVDYGLVTRFAAVVHGVNIFENADGGSTSGAIIIQYFDGAFPTWTNLSSTPFMAVYYRIITDDIVQMANPVDLAALTEWFKHYTNDDGPGPRAMYAVETATLQDALEKFTAENGDEFVNWGVVLPQNREK